jgi:hypothetical protein
MKVVPRVRIPPSPPEVLLLCKKRLFEDFSPQVFTARLSSGVGSRWMNSYCGNWSSRFPTWSGPFWAAAERDSSR